MACDGLSGAVVRRYKSSMTPFRSPKVWIAAQLPPPVNGLSTVNAGVAHALRTRSDTVTTNLSPAVGARGLKKYTGRLIQVLRAIRTLNSGRELERPVLYMPSDGGIGILANILIAVAARLRGFSLYVHHHSFAYLNRRSLLMGMLIRLSPRLTCHIVLCGDMGEGLVQTYQKAWRHSQARLLVVSNAFLLPAVGRHRLEAEEQPLTLCHVSNLTVAKGTIVFVELFEQLREAGVEVRAEIAGSTTEPEVKAALERAAANHPDHFHWHGPVYGEAKIALLESSDVFVFPTAYANEAQPLVLLEALAAGLPILTIRRGCIGCDFDSGVGLIADSPEAFADQAFGWVCALAADPERLHRYRSTALAIASAKRQEALAQLEDLVSELTATGQRRREICLAGSPA